MLHGDASLLDLARGIPDLVQSGVAGHFVADFIITTDTSHHECNTNSRHALYPSTQKKTPLRCQNLA